MAVYFPYLRGRQNELLAVRESAGLLARHNFVPIIEPVKSSTSGLERALAALDESEAESVVVLNPEHGDADHAELANLVRRYQHAGVGFLARAEHEASDIAGLCEPFINEKRPVSIVHAGFTNGMGLAGALGDNLSSVRHVFLEESTGRLYRSHFKGAERIALADGFTKKINREYADAPIEIFSELHLVFREEGMDGFGDFLIAGSDYSESGGPAYAVAIHLTFIDPKQDEVMFVHHFVSDTTNTPTDPAGKFAEALVKLVERVEDEDSPIERTPAVEEFLDLHRRGHFPGLGYVKKLSMLHHLQTLASYFES